jgi:hypothetical protein
MWSAFKELTAIMRRPRNLTWGTIELLMSGGQIEIWSRDNVMPFPNLIEEPDPDDLYSEN